MNTSTSNEKLLYTWEGNRYMQTKITSEDAEYYARKTCVRCWSKGAYKITLPGANVPFWVLCDCAQRRYYKMMEY